DQATGPQPLQSEVVVEGLQEAVQIDSVAWDARSWTLTGSGQFEINGSYALFFRNLTGQPLELRYDLRFLDRDTFLIDVFNPFGLPLRLGPHEGRRDGGEFSIRAEEPRALDELQTMQIRVVVQQAQ
ncbi:MAG: hypothetical protein HYW07_25005, partial [Candidatus Latescibacteria bacterium]|nr:hypothetical protein [Candidatus Latescibacterota bacterium]